MRRVGANPGHAGRIPIWNIFTRRAVHLTFDLTCTAGHTLRTQCYLPRAFTREVRSLTLSPLVQVYNENDGFGVAVVMTES